ncbi:transformation system protein [Arcobacter sp. CECT 8983]|uniref:type II secretion system F family protein n=1 Tax=Arcobacter sp. CECT 8983 TaxID=2044508 RepID=UPI00100B7C3D|nr:type II secretion system F family protein [Arcobacter sp. CECT 8983]RXJ89697.1 transformation system protein [Arcobacter sp. CECT 8983]
MKYKIKYQQDKKVKTLVLSESEYLKNKFPENIISIKKCLDLTNLFKSKKTISKKALLNILNELNLMLESNILFDEAFDILINSNNDKNIKEFLNKIKYSFSNHLDLEQSLKEFRVDSFVISLFKIIQNSGEPKRHIKTLYEILKEEDEVKKQIKKVFAYPLILVSSFLFALIGIFNFVVPKFENMFLQNDMKLNLATKSLFLVKNIFENYLFLILALVVTVIFFVYLLYSRSKKIKIIVHKILFENLFLISKIYRYRLMYRFFYIVNSLLQGRYEFHETIIKSKTLINNKYFLDKITRIDSSLKSGKSIYHSFEKSGIFDELVLNIIRTAEISNSIEKTSYEIRTIYKKRFNEKVEIFSILIEPIFFILIMLLIVWIIMAIFVPLWSIGDILKI